MSDENDKTLVGREFVHFKGGRYRLEGFAKHSETGEEMVVYRALYGEGGLWVRPAAMFFEHVEKPGYSGPRFKAIVFAAVLLASAALSSSAAVPRVSLDGQAVPLRTCRLSAMPFNRVWTGVQRTLDQTREGLIASFDLPRAAMLEIAGCSADAAPILYPLSESNRLTRTANGFALRLDRPTQYVVDFGPKAPPIHVFADAPYRHVPVANELYFGPGEHDVGVLAPTNGQAVVIDRGAVVKGALFLDHVTNVTVVGRGVLDNSGFTRADPRAQAFRRARGYPEHDAGFGCHACVVHACENVRFEGFVIQDTPLWALIVRGGSRFVTIDGVKVVGQWRYNSDGIDVSASSDVTVKNCFVRSFDDCLVVLGAYIDKTTARTTTERVRFENCRAWCDWGASFKLWSPSSVNTYRDIVVTNCVFMRVMATPVQIKDTAGSTDTRIEGVRLSDIEFDLTDLPLEGVHQVGDDMRYPGDRRAPALNVAALTCNWPKTDYGNQKFVKVKDPSGYRSRIADVTFERFTFPGLRPPLFATLRTEAPNQSISDIRFRDMPPVEIRTKGAVTGVTDSEGT